MGRDSAANEKLSNNIGDGKLTPKGGRNLRVYVINQRREPLMPTTPSKARKLLKEQKAKVLKRTPFTIQLTYATGETKQSIALGIDAGSKTIGLSATTEEEELFAGEVMLRNDIVDLLSTRRSLRRTRRNRKTRYRKPRFLNRRRPEGWVALSVQNKIDTHIKVVKLVHAILPITRVVVEVAQFDIQNIKNPDILGKDYQQGEQLGFYNVREYVLFRDKHTCQHCNGKSRDPILNVHHIESRKTGGNSPDNLITLCETCHRKYHAGELKLKVKRSSSFRDAAFMGIMRWAFYNKLKELYSNAHLTFGYITKNVRIKHNLEKSHRIDARCISGNPSTEESDCWYFFKQVRKQNRQLHKTNPKKGLRKANKAPRFVYGFELFDEVEYQGEPCFIFGRRNSGYFDIRKLDGTKVHASASYNKLKLLSKTTSLLCERREAASSPQLKQWVSAD